MSDARPASSARHRAGIAALLLLLVNAPVHAQVELSVTLPLGPYWRAGKYMPVHIKASIPGPEKHWVGLAADQPTEPSPGSVGGRGAGRTSVYITDGRLDAIVPWLVMDTRARRPRLFIEDRPEQALGPELRQLADGERLVGWSTPDEAFARALIAAPRIIPVQLDPALPIKGHPMTWELLDAVILDADAAARLERGQIEALVSCGVIVAIKTDRPPLPAWPWKRIGEYQVLSHRAVGPSTAGYHPNSLAPAQNWEPGWSRPFRRRMLLLAAAMCLPLLGLALWRPPLAWLWTILYVGGACVGLGKWWAGQILVQQAAGEVIVLGDGISQTDGWTYMSASQKRAVTLRWQQGMRPVFASRWGLDDIWISLNCEVSGQPREFDIRLPAGRKIAFMHRTVVPRLPQAVPERPVTSPMARLAREMYLNETGDLVGQLRTAPASAPAYGYVEIQQWNAVVIDARPSTRPSPKNSP